VHRLILYAHIPSNLKTRRFLVDRCARIHRFSTTQATDTYSAATGRLATVGNGSDTFTYGYEANSNLLASVTGPEHIVTNIWEATRNVLASKENELPGGTLSKFTYTVNDIGQRVGLTPTGSAFATTTPFVWGYNDRGELTSATRNGLTAFERAYSYDGIGNRLTATDHNAATTSYFADTASTDAGGNALNQYEKIEFPGSATIQPIHDADGNMTSGPVPGANGLNPGVPVPANASLTWDGENRLITATVDSTTVNYLYDAQSRLISRSVGVSPTSVTLYLYDGWNRIAEYEENGTGQELKRSYLWGMDLSGTMQGAGGVGGLLSMTVHDTTTATFYPTYDGNGNVSEYINESGSKVAHFEYDPFGNLTVDSESNADAFPYRFSTKPQDLTTGLYYYGYRYYDPVTGRWPSRDPIEEEGGINLYGFVGNDGVNKNDVYGLYPTEEAAVDAAKNALGREAAWSRIMGEMQIRMHYALTVRPPVTSPSAPAIFNDAVIFRHPQMQVNWFVGVAGVEFATLVYCDIRLPVNERFNFVTPLMRGFLPNEQQYNDGDRGFVPLVASPEGVIPTASLHTHTHADWFDYGQGPQNFVPINSEPSGRDLANHTNMSRFLVHEFGSEYRLHNYDP
jgi:RHS repeat-associated protein